MLDTYERELGVLASGVLASGVLASGELIETTSIDILHQKMLCVSQIKCYTHCMLFVALRVTWGKMGLRGRMVNSLYVVCCPQGDMGQDGPPGANGELTVCCLLPSG